MSDWQPIGTDPQDGSYRLYGLHLRNREGLRWFEAYYVALDTVEGTVLTPSGDIFSDWDYTDFEVWADAPQPPSGVSIERAADIKSDQK